MPGTVYGLSKKEWTDGKLFEMWFVLHFLLYAPPVRQILERGGPMHMGNKLVVAWASLGTTWDLWPGLRVLRQQLCHNSHVALGPRQQLMVPVSNAPTKSAEYVCTPL